MNRLTKEKCVACRRDSPPVSAEDVAELHPQVSEWDLISEDEIQKLDRVFRFPDFQSSLDFTNVLGALAESEGHHPNFTVNFREVEVTLWTHAVGGLSENDFILAAKINTLNPPQ